jgi:hypothetical protein
VSNPVFTCPVCGRSSWNTNDAREGYCGACHGYTTAPAPAGFRWVKFKRRAWPAFGRLLDDAGLELGGTYSILAGDEAGDYVFDGEAFVEVPAA